MSQTLEARTVRAGKYLTFKLAAEEYGLEILKVQEIIGMLKVTHVPRLPEHVRGVVNLRGKIIPVIDLRLKFGLPAKEDSARTCIVVVQVNRQGTRLIIGVLVDDVSEVLNVAANQIEPPPAFDAAVDTEFLLGMGKVGQKVVMLLDIDRVLGRDELTIPIESAAKHATEEAKL